MRHLKADSHYVWFTLIISLILIIIFYRFTHKLGMSITKLQQFAMKADRNEPIDTDMQDTFPKNELGEISQHIIQIYKRLHQAKEDLYIEREKLITHLQISHEGLGVFNHRKEEILVNNLFTQYANLISDKNLSSTEEIFSIPELQPITRFITKNKERSIGKGEKRMSLNIDKNGRIFAVDAYAGSHISVTIRCFREDERFYYFSFSDTGVGVDPEHLSRLFERFYRVDKGRSRKLGGTGLGLAIVKNAVILHGGTIFAKNTPGGGLEFIFTLSKE